MKPTRIQSSKRITAARAIGACVLLFSCALSLSAQVMDSAHYQIQSDSINFGGGRSTSTSYTLESTAGEIATGISSSTNYKLKAGYQQMQEVYLSMSAAPNVTLAPAIGGVSGGVANGSTSVTVTTDSSAGYELTLRSAASPALRLSDGSASFADYATGTPEYSFVVSSDASAFGFTPEGADIAEAFKDNGSACGTGSSDAADHCWAGLSTAGTVVAKRTSANQPGGSVTVLKFRAESGSSHVQAPGTYTATTTITAVAL